MILVLLDERNEERDQMVADRVLENHVQHNEVRCTHADTHGETYTRTGFSPLGCLHHVNRCTRVCVCVCVCVSFCLQAPAVGAAGKQRTHTLFVLAQHLHLQHIGASFRECVHRLLSTYCPPHKHRGHITYITLHRGHITYITYWPPTQTVQVVPLSPSHRPPHPHRAPHPGPSQCYGHIYCGRSDSRPPHRLRQKRYAVYLCECVCVCVRVCSLVCIPLESKQ